MNSIYLNNYLEFAGKAKSFASGFNPCAILDSCGISPAMQKGKFKLLIGMGGEIIPEAPGPKIESLFDTWNKKKSWMFGIFGFDLKNEIEKLSSRNNKCFHWPEVSFFIPHWVIKVTWDNRLSMEGDDCEAIYEQILNHKIPSKPLEPIRSGSALGFDFDKTVHATAVNAIKEEISNGNVYELNLCSRFLYDDILVSNPYRVFDALLKISPAPFAGYFSIDNRYVLSASPERYMNKTFDVLLSQPIKGTRPRGVGEAEDEALKIALRENPKDRAENVMIVDLVRNDLARVSVPGSVKVDELFGIYSYSHVHQMVSTISSKIEEAFSWKDVIKASFPMGSMTGTPKIAALQWIEKFEISAREWYSGAMGYIDPEGNFDFNVLIRSIFYDSLQKKLAWYAGGAITIDSDPEEEYYEMLVKASAINDLLERHLNRDFAL